MGTDKRTTLQWIWDRGLMAVLGILLGRRRAEAFVAAVAAARVGARR
jgi:hypothetical protein